MGRGIAELAARQGYAVRIHDAREGAAETALAAIDGALARDVEKGRIDAADADAIRNRLAAATLAGTARSDLVIEAIVEDFAAKQALFAAIDARRLSSSREEMAATLIAAVGTSAGMVTPTAARVCSHSWMRSSRPSRIRRKRRRVRSSA